MQLAAVLGLLLMSSGVAVVFSYLSRDFYSALEAKDQARFEEVIMRFVGALSLGVPIVTWAANERF